MDELDCATETLEQGNAWLDSDEVVDLEVRQPLDKVIPVRLSADKWAAVRREARELGVGPSTLVRMWVLEKLREVAATRRPA
jgi:hypothetical protein